MLVPSHWESLMEIKVQSNQWWDSIKESRDMLKKTIEILIPNEQLQRSPIKELNRLMFYVLSAVYCEQEEAEELRNSLCEKQKGSTNVK